MDDRRSLPAQLALGDLDLVPALDRPDLLAASVAAALARWDAGATVLVAEIDAEMADTAAFCERYGVGLDVSANCVVITGRRGDVERRAACVALATTRVDVNGVVRRHLDARKASFMPMDAAVAGTGMEHGGITPIGLPDDWPVLVDPAVVATDRVVVGSGLRRSKLVLPGQLVASVPGATVIDGLARPVPEA